MSLTTARSAVQRDQKAIADLRTKDAAEARKEADLTTKINRATSAAGASKSPSTVTARLKEAERATNDLAKVRQSRAAIAKQLAGKVSDLHNHQSALEQEEDRDRKRIIAEAKKVDDRRAREVKELTRSLQTQRQVVAEFAGIDGEPVQYDVFISHASEDKEGIARPLAEKLVGEGLAVWYDDTTLKWGDSLRREIDKGLARSRFGVVILSENFFRKPWPQKELDGLVQMEVMGRSRILPIWHKVSKDEVASFSPTLADKLALNTGVMSIDEIVKQLLEVSGSNKG